MSEGVIEQFVASCLEFTASVDDVSQFEVGKGEFRMQRMILDGVKEFSYEVPMSLTTKSKSNKKQDVVPTGLLTIHIRLGPPMQEREPKDFRK